MSVVPHVSPRNRPFSGRRMLFEQLLYTFAINCEIKGTLNPPQKLENCLLLSLGNRPREGLQTSDAADTPGTRRLQGISTHSPARQIQPGIAASWPRRAVRCKKQSCPLHLVACGKNALSTQSNELRRRRRVAYCLQGRKPTKPKRRPWEFSTHLLMSSWNLSVMIGQSHRTCFKDKVHLHFLHQPGLEALTKAPCHTACNPVSVFLCKNLCFAICLGTVKSTPCCKEEQPS